MFSVGETWREENEAEQKRKQTIKQDKKTIAFAADDWNKSKVNWTCLPSSILFLFIVDEDWSARINKTHVMILVLRTDKAVSISTNKRPAM